MQSFNFPGTQHRLQEPGEMYIFSWDKDLFTHIDDACTAVTDSPQSHRSDCLENIPKRPEIETRSEVMR